MSPAARSLTAHVGCEIAPGPLGRVREVYHAVTDQPVRVGFVTRKAGEPLCGAPVTLSGCPAGLFEPVVSCPACRAVAACEGVIVAGAV